MTRKEFVKLCGILGVGLPLNPMMVSCSASDAVNSSARTFDGKVVIIGAGAGGLSAGYLLAQQGSEVEILEASGQWGGRMRIHTEFADFPIPLGAEWLETDTGIFDRIVNDASVAVNVPTVPDGPDRKFVNGTWYNFYEDYILPSISNVIHYNQVVNSINYTESQVVVSTQSGEFVADKVIIATPLQILRDGDISFNPPLPNSKVEAFNAPVIWEGFKAFFEFSTPFYGEGYNFNITPEATGQKIYYNASLGQNTEQHILGLFVVGTPALDFLQRSGEALKTFILEELDGIFNGQASTQYIKHITQNWNADPFIRGGYVSDHASWQSVRALRSPVNQQLFFAGGPFTDGEDWVSVHAAAQSGKEAVAAINSLS